MNAFFMIPYIASNTFASVSSSIIGISTCLLMPSTILSRRPRRSIHTKSRFMQNRTVNANQEMKNIFLLLTKPKKKKTPPPLRITMAEIVIICIVVCSASAGATIAKFAKDVLAGPWTYYEDFDEPHLFGLFDEPPTPTPAPPPPPSEPPTCKQNTECPISLDTIQDPVMLNTPPGLLYEKSYLLQWLADKPYTDPATNQLFSQRLTFSARKKISV